MFIRIRVLLISFWHLLKVFGQMLYGTWRISKLDHPIISIFGGSRIKQNNKYAVQASLLTKMILDKDISVLTGGGPGIMEAASCAMFPKKPNRGKSIGIGVRGLLEERNHCVDEYFELNYFFARKWLLTRFSKAYIIFPGGFGTFDELFEMLTLIKTKRMERKPIILMEVEFWQPMIDWLKGQVLSHGTIDVQEFELFVLTDDVHEAFKIIHDVCLPVSKNEIKKPSD